MVGFFINQHKPNYNESIALNGIQSQVNIHYDQYAIPHIYAEHPSDAYMALGYVHAKDRLWQMEILRRIAPGRLSEIFGEGVLETDRFFRVLGMAQQSKDESDRFMSESNNEIRSAVLSYIQGINHFIDNHSAPIEYKLIGFSPERFTLEDVYNVIGYMGFSFSVAHKTEPIVSYINDTYGADYLAILDLDIDSNSTVIAGVKGEDFSDLSLHIGDIIENLPAPQLIGSNSWIIGPQKTQTGTVLFANDPHIGFAQPSVWYEAHLEAPGLSSYGNYVAGYPFPHIGNNRHHAIGLTMFENDDVDYYRERINGENPDLYRKENSWTSIDKRKEIIKVKGQEDVEMIVRSTHHGPIISDVVKHLNPDEAISMWWEYQKHPLQLLQASFLIANGQTLEEVRKGASMIHAPGLNVMYADIEGNYAWWASAKLPKRPDHVHSKMILDGASGEDEVLGYYDFDENPQAVNPPWGFVYSANNQSVSADGLRPPGYYLPEDRAKRITYLLNQNDQWTIDDVKKMLLDVTSNNVTDIINSIENELTASAQSERDREILRELKTWDGNFGLQDIAPTLYTKLMYRVMYNMMYDELQERWETFNGTFLMKRSTQKMIRDGDSPWWDKIGTDQVESRADIVSLSFREMVDELSDQLGNHHKDWRWGKVHTLEHKHSFDSNATLRKYFNVGPFPVPGSYEVINNLQYTISADGWYQTAAGPSSRRAIDMGNLESQNWNILPTGQSGNVLSPHYKDQAEMYVQGAFRRQLLNKEEIVANAIYQTTLLPAD